MYKTHSHCSVWAEQQMNKDIKTLQMMWERVFPALGVAWAKIQWSKNSKQ